MVLAPGSRATITVRLVHQSIFIWAGVLPGGELEAHALAVFDDAGCGAVDEDLLGACPVSGATGAGDGQNCAAADRLMWWSAGVHR